MNKPGFIRLIALILTLAVLSATPALASRNPGGTRATAKGPLTFRAGPGSAYAELYTLPQDTPIVAIETETADGEQWALCEFQRQGLRERAYTQLSQLDLSADIPKANHDRLKRHLIFPATVLAAPDLNADTRESLSKGEAVLFLCFEGDYCFIEYPADSGPVRGYVREESFMPDLGEFLEDFPENDGVTLYVIKETANLYTEPDESAEVLFSMPFDASVTLTFDPCYENAPEAWLPLSYGGLFGWGRFKDFSDLRFDSPEGARQTLTMMGEYED